MTRFEPGHFYSPLLDIETIAAEADRNKWDGIDYWAAIDLRQSEQAKLYDDAITSNGVWFPQDRASGSRYYSNNDTFVFSDAFVLAAMIQKYKPKKIVEVGAGFSSAVMLDTLAQAELNAAVTSVEPYPERLQSLVSRDDLAEIELLIRPVQTVDLAVFEKLEAGDILFVDSSHVAKIGSDVTFIVLRVLPLLNRGVLVHFHDIFYPMTYPMEWVREGVAWNESLFVRTLLLGSSGFRVLAFNSFAGYVFPEVFFARIPAFLANTGGSLWLEKTSQRYNAHLGRCGGISDPSPHAAFPR